VHVSAAEDQSFHWEEEAGAGVGLVDGAGAGAELQSFHWEEGVEAGPGADELQSPHV